MKLNNPQGITDFNPEVVASCSKGHIQSVLEDCKVVMKECQYWIWQSTISPDDVQVKAGLEKCLKALEGDL